MARWYESNKTWHEVNENIFRESHSKNNGYTSEKVKNDYLVGFPEFFQRKEKSINSTEGIISEINAQNYFRITK